MMKKQNLTKKKELGEFCDQFAYDSKLQYPSKNKAKTRSRYEKSRKYYKRKKKSFPKTSSTQAQSSKPRRK